jgi:hypothetical protein
MTKNEFGVWETYIPPKANGECAIPHDSMIKVGFFPAPTCGFPLFF